MLKNFLNYSLSCSLILFSVNCVPVINNLPFKNETPKKSFSIKSTTNSDEIKKIFLSKIMNKTIKENEFRQTFNFNLENKDIRRSFSLNIVNGPNNLERINRIAIKVNDEEIISPFEVDNLDFKEIKERYFTKI